MNPFETARPPEQPEHRLEARAFKVGDLLQDIQRDRLRIPSLQSRSAEGDVDARELMDNLYRGYPVGTLLLWASSEQPDILLVIEGQRRLAALAHLVLNTDDGDESALYFDLDQHTFVRPPPAADRVDDPSRWLPLNRLSDSAQLLEWLYAHTPNRERRTQALQLDSRLREYEWPAYVIRGGSEATLVEIRQRMQGGATDPVTEFLRRDAGLLHDTLLPDRHTRATLDRFFHHHPHPQPRSRELLARWIWRRALRGTSRAPDLVDPGDEEALVQRLLHAVGDAPAAWPAVTARFDVRQTLGKLQALALLALQPRDLNTGALIDLEGWAHPAFPPILNPKGPPAEDARVLSVANRLAHPARSGLRKSLLQVRDGTVLASHGISAEAFSALQAGDAQRFLTLRAATLQQHFDRFFARHARWDATDRPSLASLVVSDDEEDT